MLFNLKFNFICLSDNISSMLMIENDISYVKVFRYPLQVRLKKTALFIDILGSGSSKNVINAVEYAKEVGVRLLKLQGIMVGN